MNFCTICQSFYKDPGTCNCYSALPRQQPAFQTTAVPYVRCATCGGALWVCRGTHVWSFTLNPGNGWMTVPPNAAGPTITGSSGMPPNG